MARQYRHWGGRGHAQIQLDLDAMVRQASVIRNAEALFIPGLLQTAGYARSRMEEAVRMHAFDEAGVDAASPPASGARRPSTTSAARSSSSSATPPSRSCSARPTRWPASSTVC